MTTPTLTAARLLARTVPFVRPLASPSLVLRAYSSSSSNPAPTKDDSHPHLYFHHLADGRRIALSYLSTPPKVARSKGVMGWLPNDASAGVGDFEENADFRKFLHTSIKKAIESGSAQTVEVEATSRGSDGFMHISDERNLPPSGRIPEPEDIIASIYVRAGKALPETYEPQPMHRLLTHDGATVLPYGIDEFVMKEMEAAVQAEEAKEEQT